MPRSTAIAAGKLRHRIQLVQQTTTQGSSGGVAIDQGTVFATVWGSIEALSGRELYAAQQRVAEVTHQITIRWMDGVKAGQLAWFGDRQFTISAVQDPDERRKMLVLLAIERDDSAREEGGSAA